VRRLVALLSIEISQGWLRAHGKASAGRSRCDRLATREARCGVLVRCFGEASATRQRDRSGGWMLNVEAAGRCASVGPRGRPGRCAWSELPPPRTAMTTNRNGKHIAVASNAPTHASRRRCEPSVARWDEEPQTRGVSTAKADLRDACDGVVDVTERRSFSAGILGEPRPYSSASERAAGMPGLRELGVGGLLLEVSRRRPSTTVLCSKGTRADDQLVRDAPSA